jgi:glycyl-tRNA synthetase
VAKKESYANPVLGKLVSLTKRKGFIFQSSEIYNGINGAWDYGPLGVELKKNVKEFWWRSMVYENSNIEGVDASILMHPKVWEASGHVGGFNDPMVDCKNCKSRFRADHIDLNKPCPVCGVKDFTEAKQFNLMFKTHIGPSEESANQVYLRPETAQGIFVNFQNIRETARQKVPFGIAQIGKAFRNEINTRNFTFRSREFEQMEMQFFVKPGDEKEWFDYWKKKRLNWMHELGLKEENLQWHQHGDNELAHYANLAFDITYRFGFRADDPWEEIEGIHSRTDFDLKQHQEFSGKSMVYSDPFTNEKYIPYVVETSAGCDRTILAMLIDAYWEDSENERVVMRFAPHLAPIKAAILPLVKKDGMPEKAKELEAELRRRWNVFYDESSSVGKRYRRMDEVGTPFCITVDGQTLEDNTVTIRERDSMAQYRINMAAVSTFLEEKL